MSWRGLSVLGCAAGVGLAALALSSSAATARDEAPSAAPTIAPVAAWELARWDASARAAADEARLRGLVLGAQAALPPAPDASGPAGWAGALTAALLALWIWRRRARRRGAVALRRPTKGMSAKASGAPARPLQRPEPRRAGRPLFARAPAPPAARGLALLDGGPDA